jgi:UPF0755 protein
VKAPRRPRQWLAGSGIVLVGLFLFGSYLSYRLGLRPPASTGDAVRFEVKSGERVPVIADHLKAAGLITGRNSFISYLNFHNLRGRIKAGIYSLSPKLTGPQVADILAHGDTLTDRLVVPEGSTLKQIEKLAADHGISTTDFKAALAAPHSQAFLSGKPATVDLEGYLFPDSYQIGPTTTATTLVDTMLQTFGERVGSEYVQAFATEGLTLHQGLTLASIVEKEVSNATDRPIVAQVFIKRLKMGMPLGSDVTAKYASDLLGVPFSVDVDSKYNTRRYAGLPPGPICNPGLSALDAVTHPAHSDYLYFLSGKDGKTYFAKTYPEHQANIAKHL